MGSQFNQPIKPEYPWYTRIWQTFLYYKERGYYTFIGGNVLRIGFYYSLVVAGLVLIGTYLLDLNALLKGGIDVFSSDLAVFVLFFVSESFLGMIPPDLFMMWASKFEQAFLVLTVLGILSYAGGIVSYKIGTWIASRERIKAFTERRLEKYITLTQKWGGAFIALSALFPFSPYAMVVLAVSILRYPFKSLLWFGLFRILRFMGQGIMLIELLDLDLGAAKP
ncbi:MAG: short-chain dehydrogenase [Bacteroidetes bacterium]|nr:MAG: short-chain dehydrogenase [Bacteroidota bacterium]